MAIVSFTLMEIRDEYEMNTTNNKLITLRKSINRIDNQLILLHKFGNKFRIPPFADDYLKVRKGKMKEYNNLLKYI